jgi:hypothetical protein
MCSKQSKIDTWEGIVLESIQYIQKGKENRNVHPTYALDIDIYNLMRQRIKSVLSMMVKAGKITEGDAPNNKYYK